MLRKGKGRAKGTPLEHALGHVDELEPASVAVLASRFAEQVRLLETVVNTIREGILVIAEDGRVEFANDAAAALLGISGRKLGKSILWKLMPELTRTLDLTPDGRYAGTTLVTRELEVAYPEPRHLRLTLVPVADPKAAAVVEVGPYGDTIPEADPNRRFCVVLADLTTEVARTREQIESEKVTSVINLAAGVAHELGNPLNSLTIHLQLLARQVARLEPRPETARIEKSLEACRAEVERLDKIIRHFLEAVRPSLPDFRELDPAAVVEEVLGFLGPELEAAGIAVDVQLGSPRPHVLGDPELLRQVFFNLLKNAREAMEGKEGPRALRIRTRSDDADVYLLVGDTGSGIEPGDLGRVFTPYFTTKAGGHGLGMMIVQRIVRDHGGRIGIDSRPGEGTVVTVQLPLKDRRVRMLGG